MDTRPFDPADYLDSEESIAAYLADARADGSAALSRAVEVVTRARGRMSRAADGVRSGPPVATAKTDRRRPQP